MTDNATLPDASANPASTHPVVFSGSAHEYFPIWIVNVLLTIVTLGVYSAWAKVRNLRWFCGHTQLDGHSFAYHATGWQIFKGRVLATLLVGLLALAGVIHPALQLLSLLVFVFLVPWAINASLRFQMRVTSWRNVRFDFAGGYGRALWVYIGLPVLVGVLVLVLGIVLALGVANSMTPGGPGVEEQVSIKIVFITVGLILLAALVFTPIFAKVRTAYLVGNSRFGTAPFAANLSLKRFYLLMGRSILAALAVYAVIAVLLTGLLWLLPTRDMVAGLARAHTLVLLGYMGLYAGFGVFIVYFNTHVRNEMFNRLTVDASHRMRSTLSPWKILWLLLSNGVLIMVSLGLMLPWARVRYHRYVCGQIALLATTDLEQSVSANTQAPSSFGGEFGAMEGIATGLGV